MRTAATHQLSAASLQLGAPQRAKAPARRNQKRIWAHPRDWNGHVAAGRARWLELHGVLAHAANDVLLRREQRYVHKVERVALRLELGEASVLHRTSPNALPLRRHQQEHSAAAKAYSVERIATGAAVYAAHAAAMKVEAHDSIRIRDRKEVRVRRQRAALGHRVSQKACIRSNAGHLQMHHGWPVEAAHIVHKGIVAQRRHHPVPTFTDTGRGGLQ